MKILVTGAAGFIGSFIVQELLKDSIKSTIKLNSQKAKIDSIESTKDLTQDFIESKSMQIIGLDSINEYYDVNLKYARLKNAGINIATKEKTFKIPYNTLLQSQTSPNYAFIKLNLEDRKNLNALFNIHKFDKVCHLAAQAGVRYSLTHPFSYIDSNIVGFTNLLESCRYHSIKHLVYASSSSVYGLNATLPSRPSDACEHPISLYAATKKSNELLAHVYSHLFSLPCTALRFFSVYGPWGRPDMATFLFTKAILENKPIKIFNNGEMMRDFTYINDVARCVVLLLHHTAKSSQDFNALNPKPNISSAPFRIYNIGNNQPIKLIDFITTLENTLHKKAKKIMLPMQAGDVKDTFAECSDLFNEVGFLPHTPLHIGIKEFVKWYKKFYGI